MKKVKENKIVVEETYGDSCLVDSANATGSATRRPQGRVHIYEQIDGEQEKLIHKSNLVVYLGREMLAQRLVNTENSSATPTKDEFVAWLGLGDGGVRTADPLDPVPPINSDEYLYSPIMISDTTGTYYADPHTAGEVRVADSYVYPSTGFYKKNFDTGANQLAFEQDTLNDDKYLVIKIQTTIGVNDANGSQLSEAGLFSAESASPNYAGQFSLFARVTFPSLIKSSDRRLLFVWYLYV